jgi:hypothetical protein
MGAIDSAAPTIGSIGGGILGTIVGGPLGGIAGAGIGGGLGKGIENETTGKGLGVGSDLASAAEGAGGQALGEGLVGGAGKLLGGIGGSALAGNAADTATKALLKDQLDSHVLPNGVSADNVISTLMDNGISDLSKVPSIFGQLTGKAGMNGSEGGGLYNSGVTGLLQDMESKGTKIFGNYSDQTAKDATSGSQGANFVNDSSRTAAQNYINQQLKDAGLLKEALGGGKKVPSLLTPNVEGGSPLAVQQSIKNLRDAVRDQPFEGNGKATQQAYAKVADQLSNDLLNHPEAQLTPAMKDGMKADLQSSLGATSPKTVATQSKIIDDASTAQHLNSAQQKLVEAIRAAQSPVSKSEGINAGGLLKKAIAPVALGSAGPIGVGAGLGLDALTGSVGGKAALAKGAQAAPGILSGIGGALTSKAAIGAGGALGAGTVNGAGQAAGNTTDINPTSSVTGGIGGASMDNNSSGGTLANGSASNSSDLLSQLDQMIAADPNLASALAPQMAALMQKTQAINAAQAALQQYQQTLGSAGGGQGALGGLLAKLGGFLGGPARQVGPEAQAAQQALSAAGLPGVQLPGLTSTAGGVNAGLGQAQSMLGAIGAQ